MEPFIFRQTASRLRREVRAVDRHQRLKEQEVITLEESEDDESPSAWRCSICPVNLELQTIRILSPCGHVVCEDCADSMSSGCSKCLQSYNEKIQPQGLGECEVPDVKIEEKKVQTELTNLNEEITRLEREYEKSRSKWTKEEENFDRLIPFLKGELVRMEKENIEAQKQHEKTAIEEKIISFLSQIENHKPYPFESCPRVDGVYMQMAIKARNKFKELRTNKKRELETFNQELKKLTQENEDFDKFDMIPFSKQNDTTITDEDSDYHCRPKRACVLDDEDFENSDDLL
ncbi:hypothetical protein M3Y98_01188600 [Aphelenchoides besseyi]|nr:hypothetical protein M3Y98_01188600 [Aphelenchoides besseyi]KAI6195276.1 hypothetical protein M3Y96_01213700 [Aphelenchoides besseyi]